MHATSQERTQLIAYRASLILHVLSDMLQVDGSVAGQFFNLDGEFVLTFPDAGWRRTDVPEFRLRRQVRGKTEGMAR